MNIFHKIQDFKSDKPTTVTLGTFDGVHLGHKKIIERLTSHAPNEHQSLVLTFFPHPRMVLQEKTDIKLHGTVESLTISVDTPQYKYYKDVELPAKVRVAEAHSTYKNGVLEVVLPKAESANKQVGYQQKVDVGSFKKSVEKKEPMNQPSWVKEF